MKKTHTIGLLTALVVTIIGFKLSSDTIFATSTKENIVPIQQSEGQTVPEETPAPTVPETNTEVTVDEEWIYEDCHRWMNTEEGRAWHESMHDDEGEHRAWMESEEGQQHHRGRGMRNSDGTGRGSRNGRCH